ncbi:Myb-like DNA-binding domain containing protein [Histomonas meleagridis]|uniref:Myb-like DNA-binding domain containing protein n=1 Tax=Histomonas meleagridis TaxID=135588 RepID=UPI00355955D9|nr:Myb-like DNA-binding domain containing protein [Histomonas meleagridis]KAH0803335.1 Myb-like DNA-binding domain containing protein [Histomonas meleagridis]
MDKMTHFAQRTLFLFLSNEVDEAFPQASTNEKKQIVNISFMYINSNIGIDQVSVEIRNNKSYFGMIQKIMQIRNENNVIYPSKPINFPNFYYSKRSPKWTQYEDLRLLCGVLKYGPKNWKSISAFLGETRSSGQCNQRWSRTINPEIKHTKWTESEDKLLLHLVQQGITRWKQISQSIPGRTDLQCRYRHKQLMNIEQHTSTDKVEEPPPPNIKEVKPNTDTTLKRIFLPHIIPSPNGTITDTKPPNVGTTKIIHSCHRKVIVQETPKNTN